MAGERPRRYLPQAYANPGRFAVMSHTDVPALALRPFRVRGIIYGGANEPDRHVEVCLTRDEAQALVVTFHDLLKEG